MSTTAQKYATYKGKTYRLMWEGKTKFGDKAKLAFLDGSKEFWVDRNLISHAAAPQRMSAGTMRERGFCNECGERILSKTQHCWEVGGYCHE